jgi:hypothetical protein
MFNLRSFFSDRLLHDLTDRYGDIRAHGAANRTKNAVFGTGLERREISLGIDLFGNFQNILGTDGNAQTATLATVPVDSMQILHGITPFRADMCPAG